MTSGPESAARTPRPQPPARAAPLPASRPPASRLAACGFTLLEVVLAVSLVALFLLPLLVVRNRSIETTADAQWQRRAAELARQKMAELALEGAGATPETTGTFETRDGTEFTWELEMTPSEGGTGGGDVLDTLLGTGGGGAPGTGGGEEEESAPAYWEVRLTVFYPSMRLGTREFVVSTLLPNPLADQDTGPSDGGNGAGPGS